MKNIVVVVLAALFAVGCAVLQDRILEAKDTMSLRVTDANTPPATVLTISGLSGHSTLAVREVTQRLEGDSLEFLVHLALTGSSALRGDFDCDVVIQNSVNVVQYGNEKTIIWRRSDVISKVTPLAIDTAVASNVSMKCPM